MPRAAYGRTATDEGSLNSSPVPPESPLCPVGSSHPSPGGGLVPGHSHSPRSCRRARGELGPEEQVSSARRRGVASMLGGGSWR